MAKQFYENRNPNDLKFLTRFECGNKEKRRWNDYLSSEKSDTESKMELDSVKSNLPCIHFIAVRSNQYILIYSSKDK
jgi:hypothetical protein